MPAIARLGLILVLLTAGCATPPQSHVEQLAACLRGAGWDAEVVGEDGMDVDFGGQENRVAFMRDMDVCQARFPAPSLAPLTDEEIRARYAYLLQMRECLTGLGYQISEPPSEQEFANTWDTGPWSPYLDVPTNALDRVEPLCPQTSPDR